MSNAITITVSIDKDIVRILLDRMEYGGLSFEQALGQAICEFQRAYDPMAEQKLKEELTATKVWLDKLNELLEAVPDCPEYGSRCIPCAIEWMNEHKHASEAESAETKKVFEGLYDTLERSERRTEYVRKELEVTEALLEERNGLLELIPACPVHGDQCVPHAIAWVKTRLREECQCEYVCR